MAEMGFAPRSFQNEHDSYQWEWRSVLGPLGALQEAVAGAEVLQRSGWQWRRAFLLVSVGGVPRI